MLEHDIGVFVSELEHRVHVAERCAEDDVGAFVLDEVDSDSLEVLSVLGHALDEQRRGARLVFRVLAALIVRPVPAGVTDRADQHERGRHVLGVAIVAAARCSQQRHAG